MNIRDYMIIHEQEGGGGKTDQRACWDTTSLLEHAGKCTEKNDSSLQPSSLTGTGLGFTLKGLQKEGSRALKGRSAYFTHKGYL